MHDRIAVNHLCLMQSSIPEFADQLRDLGAHRVSLLGAYLLRDGGEAAARDLIASGPYVPETITHNFQSGRHLSTDPAAWEAPRADLSRLIAIAAAIGARSIYMVTGGHGGLVWEEAAEAFAGAIAPCVDQARAAGVQLMVETANPFMADVHIAHSLADTIRLAEIARIGVCIDLFASWTESDLRGLIRRAMPGCAIVQLSDYVYGDRVVPGRAVPGDGNMPLERLLGWVLEAGYEGAFDLELGGPRIAEEGPLAAVRRSAEAVTQLLDRLGA